MKKSIAILLGLIVFVCGFIYAVTPDSTPSRDGGAQFNTISEPAIYEVEYRIGGTSKEASLTYENDTGGTVQEDIRLATQFWTEKLRMEAGDFYYISAQSLDGVSHRTISCEVRVNGVPAASSESKGEYVIADCSGIVGRD